MNCKIFFVLAMLFIISSKGNALKCQSCKDDTGKDCVGSPVTCPDGTQYCYSASYTQQDGVKVFEKGCDKKYCPDAADTCRKETKLYNLKSCSGMCCNTDDCNSGRGNALKCQSCKDDTGKDCVGSPVTCPDGTQYCYSASYTQQDGVKVFEKGCDKKYCPDAADTCRKETKLYNLKSCSGMCCNTDDCNSGRGIVASTFSICFMLIVGYFLA